MAGYTRGGGWGQGGASLPSNTYVSDYDRQRVMDMPEPEKKSPEDEKRDILRSVSIPRVMKYLVKFGIDDGSYDDVMSLIQDGKYNDAASYIMNMAYKKRVFTNGSESYDISSTFADMVKYGMGDEIKGMFPVSMTEGLVMMANTYLD